MWSYKCNLGLNWTGKLIKVIEGQGSDITYVMESTCGKTHVLSGKTLRTLKRKAY